MRTRGSIPEKRALFIFPGRISARREVSDPAAADEGIAPAIAEEADAADESLAAGRKLAEKVNKGQETECLVKEYLITILRDAATSLVDFRRATHKLASILAAEASSHLRYDPIDVLTPLAHTKGVTYGRQLILAPVLRSGLALLPTFLNFFDNARVGMIGAARDEQTAIAHGYYCKLPTIHPDDDVIILDPMIATGGSGAFSLKAVIDAGASEERVIYVSVIAAPEGLAALHQEFPKVHIITTQIDEKLNDRKFILPGLGDFGDRFFGTL